MDINTINREIQDAVRLCSKRTKAAKGLIVARQATGKALSTATAKCWATGPAIGKAAKGAKDWATNTAGPAIASAARGTRDAAVAAAGAQCLPSTNSTAVNTIRDLRKTLPQDQQKEIQRSTLCSQLKDDDNVIILDLMKILVIFLEMKKNKKT